MKLYSGISIDPAWPEKGGGKIKRGATRHYAVTPLSRIALSIMASPLWTPNPLGCFVWLWCPSWRVAVGQAAELLTALRVRPVRKWEWVKGRIVKGEVKLNMMLGQYGRGSHEDLVLGVVGKLKPLPAIRKMSDVLFVDNPRLNGRVIHSAKPDEMYDRIRRATPGPLAALFERKPREGFDTWGMLDGESSPLRVARWHEKRGQHE